MFHHNDPWPISIASAIQKTGLKLKKMKVFALLRNTGALDDDNMPDSGLIENGFLTYDFEQYRKHRSAYIPRIASPKGLEWFENLMRVNLDKVS